jgi:hypothetical protein
MKTRDGIALAMIFLLAACGREAAAPAAPRPEPQPEPAKVGSPIAAEIIAPEESADPEEPPSYEVAIASAAADHNQALERCKQQPEAVRTQCEQEANAAFSDSRERLQDLRGNQQ